MRRVTAALALAGALALPAGCIVPSSRPQSSERLLAWADSLTGQGDYPGAVGAYDELIRRYPETPAAARARSVREALLVIEKLRVDLAARDAELAEARRALAAREGDLAAREGDLAVREEELAARASDVVRLRQDVTARDAELNKLRAEVVARQAEVTRLATESERLRADLDKLNRLDLRLEQSGAKRR